MAASVANSRKALASSVNTASTDPFDSTSGNTIWVSVSDVAGQGDVEISDNKGNTGNFVQIETTQTTALGGSQLRRFYCENILGGAGHVVTVTWDANADAVACVLELAGVPTSGALDGSNQTDDGSPPWLVTSPTPSQADTIALTAISSSWAGTWAESTGFTVDQQEGDNSKYWTSAAASKVLTTAAAVTPSWTITGGGSGAALSVDIFKASAGGGTSPTSAVAAAGAATVAGAASSVAKASASPASGAATVSAASSAVAKTTATPAVGVAIVSATTPQSESAAEIWAYVLSNGKTAGQNLAEINAVLTGPVEGDIDMAGAIRVLLAVAAGKTSIVSGSPGTATVEFRAIDDSETRVSADMVGSERIDVTITP